MAIRAPDGAKKGGRYAWGQGGMVITNFLSFVPDDH